MINGNNDWKKWVKDITISVALPGLIGFNVYLGSVAIDYKQFKAAHKQEMLSQDLRMREWVRINYPLDVIKLEAKIDKMSQDIADIKVQIAEIK